MEKKIADVHCSFFGLIKYIYIQEEHNYGSHVVPFVMLPYATVSILSILWY